MAKCASPSIGLWPVYVTTQYSFWVFLTSICSVHHSSLRRILALLDLSGWLNSPQTHIPVLQTHPGNYPSLGMMSSQHCRRPWAYVTQGPAPHWFSTPPQYTTSLTAQHSPHKYVQPRQCGPNPRIHRIHRRQHVTDDAGISKHRLSPYYAYYHNDSL